MKWHNITFQQRVKKKVKMLDNVILFAETIVKKHKNFRTKILFIKKHYKFKHKEKYSTKQEWIDRGYRSQSTISC